MLYILVYIVFLQISLRFFLNQRKIFLNRKKDEELRALKQKCIVWGKLENL